MLNEILKCVEIVVIIIFIYLILDHLIRTTSQLISIKESMFISRVKLDSSALEALDRLIKDVLDEYEIFYLNIKIKESSYISSKEEQEMINFVQEEVGKRISPILLKKLEYNINGDCIGNYIGTRIYMIVLDFVLGYNTSAKKEEM
jgi:hypothetical protein